MRVDGVLRAVAAPAQALISRLKITSGLNIAERRLPQDGGARLRIGRAEIDVRVAMLPTQHGESAVIGLLLSDRPHRARRNRRLVVEAASSDLVADRVQSLGLIFIDNEAPAALARKSRG